jgi:hypothetical protein
MLADEEMTHASRTALRRPNCLQAGEEGDRLLRYLRMVSTSSTAFDGA